MSRQVIKLLLILRFVIHVPNQYAVKWIKHNLYRKYASLIFIFLFLSLSFVLTLEDHFYNTPCKHLRNKLFELSSCNTISLIRYVSAIICYRRNWRQRYLSFRMYEEKQLCNLFYCYIFYNQRRPSISVFYSHTELKTESMLLIHVFGTLANFLSSCTKFMYCIELGLLWSLAY